jgi:predicted lipoprotein with Yx(FWY)xxD motif
MHSRLLMIALIVIGAIAVVACSSPGAASTSPAAASVAPSTAPSEAASTEPSAAPSEAPSEAPSAATGGATVEAKPVGTIGTVLVAGSNGMTVYNFTMDTKDSGTSACTGGCSSTWPALTVAAGATPTGGAGVTGTLGTITRDDGTLQVTYNGLPLYFFKNDKAPGDAAGVYQNWEAVKP